MQFPPPADCGSSRSPLYAYKNFMIKFSRIIHFWGLCDLGYILWYLIWNVIHARIPFYGDFIKSTETASSLGSQLPIWAAVVTFILYISMLFSGYYLLRQNKISAIICYIQTPFRLLTFIPPSIFFIFWPLKYIFKNPEAISAIITLVVLMLLSESLKLSSVIIWRKRKSAV
jgi:hypothetical protein